MSNPTENTPLNGASGAQSNGGTGHRQESWWSSLVVIGVSFALGAVLTGLVCLVAFSSVAGLANRSSPDDNSASHPSTISSTTGGVDAKYHFPLRHHQDDFVHLDDTSNVDDDDEFGEKVRYRATQFISFTINTIGGIAEQGECDGKPIDPTNGFCYLGNSQNITTDVQHRMKIVQQVLQRIRRDAFGESPDVDHANDVLKIVMLPEFFWRGPNGAYSTQQLLDDRGALSVVNELLKDLIADEFFEHYLFVFGTVIAAQSKDDEDGEPWQDALKSAEEVEYFNFAAISKGGPEREVHPHHYVVTKKYISGADFLSRTTLPNPTNADMHDYAQMNEALEEHFRERNTTVITDNVIMLDGLRIGVEICLDHRLGVLWNELRTQEDAELVDVLLVTSAGMAIERGPNPIVPGGVVYLSDGEASSAACMRTDDTKEFYPNQVCRGDIGGLKQIPIGGPGYSSFFGLTACWDLESLELLQGYYSLYQPQGCAYTLKTYNIDVMDEFAYYPPSIEIYPTVTLPEGTYDD